MQGSWQGVLESITAGPQGVSAQELPAMDNQQAEQSGLMGVTESKLLLLCQGASCLPRPPGLHLCFWKGLVEAITLSFTNRASVIIKVFHLILCLEIWRQDPAMFFQAALSFKS